MLCAVYLPQLTFNTLGQIMFLRVCHCEKDLFYVQICDPSYLLFLFLCCVFSYLIHYIQNSIQHYACLVRVNMLG